MTSVNLLLHNANQMFSRRTSSAEQHPGHLEQTTGAIADQRGDIRWRCNN
jgi:phospholipid/cholesterol/gamma-HCH transport system substrate-binding protein